MTDSIDRFSGSMDKLFPDEPRPELHFSSIASCARAQLYRIRKVPPTNPREGWRRWAPEMGHMVHMMAALNAQEQGYEVGLIRVARRENGTGFSWVVERDPEAYVSWHGIIGEVDGEISGLDISTPYIFEVKGRSAFGYLDLVEAVTLGPEALLQRDPSTALQIQGYMAARDRPATRLWVVAFDQAAVREKLRIRKLDFHPQLTEATIPAVPAQQQLVARRAEAITLAHEGKMKIVPEYIPGKDKFPCDYCDWKTVCVAEGISGDMAVPGWR